MIARRLCHLALKHGSGLHSQIVKMGPSTRIVAFALIVGTRYPDVVYRVILLCQMNPSCRKFFGVKDGHVEGTSDEGGQ